ncbi:proton-conducting transporter transmembrane domain-containing protein [Pontibacter vulgaris]|uniref:proton-conducting transporter transmembrane domain-containing protein n=1 Tax=Pontibacter vulgaris TaxID=2905679 RepID=UPI001FA803AD|nr:proton-conducting transporter membrane subunit [Pontibacter vulgaris]
MNHLLLLLPLLIPIYGALLCLFSWRNVALQKIIALMAQSALFVTAVLLLLWVNANGIVLTQIGNWPAPFGITIVADLFSCLILLSSTVIGVAVSLYSLYGLDEQRQRHGYYPIMLLLQLGVSGACLTGDLFNLFVWFEVLLICCFVLMALGGTRPQLEASIKYMTINFLASGFLLTGIGVMYGLTGTLNMAELARMVRTPDPDSHQDLVTMASMFFLVAFGIKSAVFPLFFWLPASYHTPPVAISAFIAGIVTKVGVYAMVRLFTLVFIPESDFTLLILSVIAGLTMVIGVLGAAAHYDFRKILSFHIVSQIGYMIMGLALFTPLALGGAIYFIIHNILVKTNLFLISGVVAKQHGTFALKDLGGVYASQPFLALLFGVSAFSLAGLPPLSGFWGKFMLAKAGLETGSYLLVTTSLVVSLLTLFSMTKIWNEVFWKMKPVAENTNTTEATPHLQFLYFPVIFLTCFILFISFFAAPLINLASRAAQQLFHPELYMNAILKPPLK